QGIANGTLVWAQGGLQRESSSLAPASTASAAPAYTPSAASSIPAYVPQESPQGPPSGPPDREPSEEPHGPSSWGPSSGSPSGWSGEGSGVDSEFPDGELSCDNFPSEYGAVSVDWIGLGGWTGVQKPGSSSGGYGDILTVTSGGGCTEGAFCSYACPPGYQKAQWPETQGVTGQSVGGVLCEGGKLRLTNHALSNKLCIPGASQVDIRVRNDMGDHVAVCRTDYPGTEGETVPLSAQPGSENPLTCPDAEAYYMWQGSHTSAQYYVNPAGVSVEDGCQWGSPENPWGNYAPLNLGVGYSNGAAWLSIFQNAPTTDVKLDFSVEIKGDGVSGTCRYSNGQYCGGANYDDCSSTTGCTVSISEGTATFVFSS
ncbi:Sperm-associated antigen 4 protein, partial [Vermiconidia calcicola]